MPVRAPWRRRSPSPHWSWCWLLLSQGSARWRRKFAVLTPPGRVPAWRPAETLRSRSRRLNGSLQAGRSSRLGASETTGRSSLSTAQTCCPLWISSPGRLPPPNRGEGGAATVLAALLVAVLVVVVAAGAYLGSAIIARHRAQAAADLAALASAARLPLESQTACAAGVSLANSMVAGQAECVVDGLDAVVTVSVQTPFGATARATARAGPAR